MVRAAIVGTGWGARVQVPAFRASGIEIAGIAGNDPDRTARVAADLGVPSFDSWQALLASSDAELLSIVVPPDMHHEIATAALRAGLHVVCEKPTALNRDQAAEMNDLASSRPGQISIIDHELRFLPTWIRARELMRERSLRFAEIRYASPSRGDRERRWNWWSDAGQGGGVWGAVGSHFVDALRYLTGDEIVRVSGVMHTAIDERPDGTGSMRPVTSDDCAFVNLELARRSAIATMTLSAVAAIDEETTVTFHCEEGGVRLAGHSLFVSDGGEWREEMSIGREGTAGNSPGGPFGTGTHYLARALVRALAARERSALEPAATFADGLAQQAVLDAARLSSRLSGAWTAVATA